MSLSSSFTSSLILSKNCANPSLTGISSLIEMCTEDYCNFFITSAVRFPSLTILFSSFFDIAVTIRPLPTFYFYMVCMLSCFSELGGDTLFLLIESNYFLIAILFDMNDLILLIKFLNLMLY